jgi:hypothetical protein
MAEHLAQAKGASNKQSTLQQPCNRDTSNRNTLAFSHDDTVTAPLLGQGLHDQASQVWKSSLIVSHCTSLTFS